MSVDCMNVVGTFLNEFGSKSPSNLKTLKIFPPWTWYLLRFFRVLCIRNVDSEDYLFIGASALRSALLITRRSFTPATMLIFYRPQHSVKCCDTVVLDRVTNHICVQNIERTSNFYRSLLENSPDSWKLEILVNKLQLATRWLQFDVVVKTFSQLNISRGWSPLYRTVSRIFTLVPENIILRS